MAKYKTIVDNLNVYYNDEVAKTLPIGTTIEVEKFLEGYELSGIIPQNNKTIAILKDGYEIIARYKDKETIKLVRTKKKGE